MTLAVALLVARMMLFRMNAQRPQLCGSAHRPMTKSRARNPNNHGRIDRFQINLAKLQSKKKNKRLFCINNEKRDDWLLTTSVTFA